MCSSTTLPKCLNLLTAVIISLTLEFNLAMPRLSLAKLHPHFARVGIDRSLNSDYQFPDNYTVQYVFGQTGSKTASLGGRQTLTCISFPEHISVPYIVQWKRDGFKDPVFMQYDNYPSHTDEAYKERVYIRERGALEIRSIRRSDEGWYECKIILLDGQDGVNNNGSWIHLSVHTPPRITSSPPKFLQLSEGESVSLVCNASGSPTPTVSWSKDGKPLRNTYRVRVIGHRIVISAVRQGDGGEYRCTFSNIIGEISQLINIVIEGSTLITEHPENTTTIQGQSARMTCGAQAYPNNLTFIWTHNGVRVSELPDFPRRISIDYSMDLMTSYLIISVTIKQDMGWYNCRASNGVGSDKEAIAFLNVTYLPRLLPMNSQVFVPLGSPSQIVCSVDANPPVHTIIWIKDGDSVDFTDPRLSRGEDGALIIAKVRMSDGGNYACTPINSLGRGQSSPAIQVIVRNPPRFVAWPNEHYQRQVSMSVTMPCVAAGMPTPIIIWKKDGNDVLSSSRIRLSKGNLTINNLVKSDYGRYECIAKNSITSIVRSTTLYIEGTTPHAPQNVSVLPGLFHAQVTWSPAYSGGPEFEQNYMLWYRKAQGENGWQTLAVNPPSATMFTVHNLEPNTLYDFQITSRNHLGNGLPSEIVMAKTLDYFIGAATALPTDSSGSSYIPPLVRPLGDPPTPPINVDVTQSDSVIHIQWDAPLNSTVPVFYYMVQMSQDYGESWLNLPGKVHAPASWYDWGRGQPGRLYYFQVVSVGVMAYSEPSQVVQIEAASAVADTALIGGIIGAISFLLVAILVGAVVILCNRRRRQREAGKFDHVRYSGPQEMNDTDGKSPTERYHWDEVRGGSTLRSRDRNSYEKVFTITGTYDDKNGFESYRPRTWRQRIEDRPSIYGDPHSRKPERSRSVPVRHETPTPPAGFLNHDPDISRSFDSFRPVRHLEDSRRAHFPQYRPESHTPSIHGDRESSYMQRQPRSPLADEGYDGPYRHFYPGDEGDIGDESGSPRSPSMLQPQYTGRPQFPRHSSAKPASSIPRSHLPSSPDLSSVIPASYSDLPSHDEPVYPGHARHAYPMDHSVLRPSKPPRLRLEPPLEEDGEQLDTLGRSSSGSGTPFYPTVSDSIIDSPLAEQDSSDSSGRPIGYTRDHLQGAVDRIRRSGPKGRRPLAGRHQPYIDPDSAGLSSGQRSPSSGLGTTEDDDHRDISDPHEYINPFQTAVGVPDGRASLSSSGRGSLGKAPGTGLPQTLATKQAQLLDPYMYHRPYTDLPSDSSGFGSRNASQSTGSTSFQGHPPGGSIIQPHPSLSASSIGTHQDYDTSGEDLTPYVAGTTPNGVPGFAQKDVSGDENYEFDPFYPDGTDYDNQYPSPYPSLDHSGRTKTGRPSHHRDESERRFERLREEFQQFRQRQQERMIQSQWSAMDSEML